MSKDEAGMWISVIGIEVFLIFLLVQFSDEPVLVFGALIWMAIIALVGITTWYSVKHQRERDEES